jgi:hypothetical protein
VGKEIPLLTWFFLYAVVPTQYGGGLIVKKKKTKRMWVIHPYSSDCIAFDNGRLLFRHQVITLRRSSNGSFFFEESKMEFINNGDESSLVQGVLKRSPQNYNLSVKKNNYKGQSIPKHHRTEVNCCSSIFRLVETLFKLVHSI